MNTTAKTNSSNPRRRPARISGTPEGEARLMRRLIWSILPALIIGIGMGVLLVRHLNNQPSVLALVNGAPIDRDAFERRVCVAADDRTLMRDLVAEELALQFAAKQGIIIDNVHLNELYSQESKRPGFKTATEASGQTPDDIKQQLHIRYARLYTATRGLNVTDAEVRRLYEKNIDRSNPAAAYYAPETTQVEVIITKDRRQGERALQSLHEGMPFNLAAQNYSQDQSRSQGGRLPTIVRGRNRLAEFPGLEEALFRMESGETHGPRQFGNAWWLIHCLSKTEEITIPYEAVHEDCRMRALLAAMPESQHKKIESEFQDYQKKARVQAFKPRYRNILSEVLKKE